MNGSTGQPPPCTEDVAIQYHELHCTLSALWAAPVPDMVQIDGVMAKLDDLHAQLKARHRLPGDTQRY